LVTTSLDSTIRTFDIPTGTLIDAFRTKSVATSISFSPTNDFLATAHVDSVGIFLWANRAQFDNVTFGRVVEEDVVDVNLPSVQGGDEDEGMCLNVRVLTRASRQLQPSLPLRHSRRARHLSMSFQHHHSSTESSSRSRSFHDHGGRHYFISTSSRCVIP